ncbi:2-phospho-L-lactate transferase [Micromonospora sp. WMMD882]|uniref:2-phospho-L-lactate transferase n=1 Tax=Micromonospora sp. WMMD882 TaxID=3015151 RepID=UPI00248C23E8|nr:2-phospho-L-lactate transferase [Micromonospora sp. WMMD882]WBB77381.1 2-phospho-L-lactate transferase [Micromonospora sp. WMMD882]
MRIVVLAGGIGGARFLLGVRAYARRVGAEVTAVVNVGDDLYLHGLKICPDLDSVMYTLGGGADPERGWGRADETWTVKAELAAYGAEPTWFGLGDRDVATHLVRTSMIEGGYPLSAVTGALATRWQPGVRLLPATDDRLETHAIVSGGGPAGADGQRAIHFQEWWVRHRADIPTHRFVFVGADAAKPAPGVVEALGTADLVLVAPSNPVVSIAPILAVPGLREAVAAGPGRVVGVSPIIGGAPVRGMADRCLAVLGVECSAEGVGRMYGGRRSGGLLDGWLVAPEDGTVTVPAVTVRATPLWMTDETATADMVRAAVELV